VFIYQDTVPNCSTASVLTKPTVLRHNNHPKATAGDAFGAALAIGILDTDSRADLAIGAPNHDGGKGTVYLYNGVKPTGAPAVWGPMAIEAKQLSPSLTAQFGSSIAIGKVLAFGRQVVVGAPATSATAPSNKVIVFSGTAMSTFTQTQTLIDDTDKPSDQFGAALAIGNVEHGSATVFDDLVVGVPGEDSRAGAVVVFRGGDATFLLRTKLLQSQMPFADRDSNDQFGASLAVGNFNGADSRPSTADTGSRFIDLVIGAPGEHADISPGSDSPADGGAFDMWRGNSAGIVTPSVHRHQEVAGRASNP
jgi:hypothetical protein